MCLTKAAVQEAARFGASVEAELGHVAGGEGNLTEGTAANPDDFTDPNEAARFVEETGVDALAIAIGTVHGPYQGEPRLELDLLSQIREAVSVPLVLHGTVLGLSPDDFRQAIARASPRLTFSLRIPLPCSSHQRTPSAGQTCWLSRLDYRSLKPLCRRL